MGKKYKESGKIKRSYYMAHMLSLIPYKDLTPDREELPPRPQEETGYVRPPMSAQNLVPAIYGGDVG